MNLELQQSNSNVFTQPNSPTRKSSKPSYQEAMSTAEGSKRCTCGQSLDRAPNKIRRHLAVRHCYCYDCKGVFTKHLHQKTKPSHRIGTYSVFPPPENSRPPRPDVASQISQDQREDFPDVADGVNNASVEPRRTRSRAARTRRHEELTRITPDQPRTFTLWCLSEDTDDSGEVIHKYKPDRGFCNVSISLQLASARHNPWVPKAAKWKELQRSFPGFLKAGNPTQDTHQSLLTSLIATASDEEEMHGAIRGWDRVRKHLKHRDLHREFQLDPSRDLLVIVFMDTGFPYKSSITEQYDTVEEYLQVIDSGRTIVYPSREERTTSEYKVQDIRALDTIAEAQKTWRPVTCFGVGECTLVGIKDIVKRSWSCASVHAIADGTHSSKLTCSQSKRQIVCMKNKQTMAADMDEECEEVWFHQEYVKPLASEELRVFIATRPDQRGVRGLLGEVLRVCHTISEEKDDMVATEAMEGTYASLGTTKAEVHSFALGVFEALRDPEFGWFGRFESLEVGCRLDISVNEVGGALFVNEITRWNGAHYFSDFCTGAPHALMCNAYATAMGRYVEDLGK